MFLRFLLVQSPCKDPLVQLVRVLAVLPLAAPNTRSGEIKLEFKQSKQPRHPPVCVLVSGVHAVLRRLSSLRLPPLREDESALAVAGLRWDLRRHPRLLRPRNLLRLLL